MAEKFHCIIDQRSVTLGSPKWLQRFSWWFVSGQGLMNSVLGPSVQTQPGIDYGAEVAFKYTLSFSLYQWNARVMVYTPTPNFWCDLKGFGEFIKSRVIVKLAYFGWTGWPAIPGIYLF